MEISISSWAYRSLFDTGQIDLLSFVDEVKRLGADGLELFPEHLDEDDPGGSAQRVADKAEALGLRISSIIARNDFARPTARERSEHVAAVKEWIRRAASAGIRRLNTFTGHHTEGEDPALEYYRVLDSYREVMPLAEENNVLLCVENLASVCRGADELMQLIEAVGSDYLRTNPDLLNFAWEFARRGEPAPEHVYTDIATVLPRASNLHLNTGVFTAEGETAYLDMQRIAGMLRDACFDEHIVLETPADVDPVRACAGALEMIRKYLVN
ncbi:MAG: TIM barrel protein [Chitinivibrionales bacterium]|nr:TIM barrel protein [Chitinivibrionales bacterium]